MNWIYVLTSLPLENKTKRSLLKRMALLRFPESFTLGFTEGLIPSAHTGRFVRHLFLVKRVPVFLHLALSPFSLKCPEIKLGKVKVKRLYCPKVCHGSKGGWGWGVYPGINYLYNDVFSVCYKKCLNYER